MKKQSDRQDRSLFWLCIAIAVIMGLSFLRRLFT